MSNLIFFLQKLGLSFEKTLASDNERTEHHKNLNVNREKIKM